MTTEPRREYATQLALLGFPRSPERFLSADRHVVEAMRRGGPLPEGWADVTGWVRVEEDNT